MKIKIIILINIVLTINIYGFEVSESLEKKIIEEKEFLLNKMKGEGNVIVGKLIVEGGISPRKINSHTMVDKDGYFAAVLHNSRKKYGLNFRFHGYEPLNIIPPKNANLVWYVGEVILKKTPINNLTSIEGSVTLNNNKDPNIDINIYLLVNTFAIWNDGGSESNQYQRSRAGTLKINNKDGFIFEDLSQIKYSLSISAENYLYKSISIDADRKKNHNLGNIILEKAPLLKIYYISQFEKSITKFNIFDFNETTLVCNNINKFLFYSDDDNSRNNLELRMNSQKDGKVKSSYSYGDSYFYKINSVSKNLKKVNFSHRSLSRRRNAKMSDVILKNRTLYYFECNDKKANCLFFVEYIK